MALEKGTGVFYINQVGENKISSDSVEQFGKQLGKELGFKVKEGGLFSRAGKMLESQSKVAQRMDAGTLLDLYKEISQDFAEHYNNIAVTKVSVGVGAGNYSSLEDLANFDETDEVVTTSVIEFETEDKTITGYLHVGVTKDAEAAVEEKAQINSLKDFGATLGTTIVFAPVGIVYGANAIRRSLDKNFKENSWYEIGFKTTADIESKQARKYEALANAFGEKHK